eukprot:10102441-Ditylum_brightwellii.AAC.1
MGVMLSTVLLQVTVADEGLAGSRGGEGSPLALLQGPLFVHPNLDFLRFGNTYLLANVEVDLPEALSVGRGLLCGSSSTS